MPEIFSGERNPDNGERPSHRNRTYQDVVSYPMVFLSKSHITMLDRGLLPLRKKFQPHCTLLGEAAGRIRGDSSGVPDKLR